MDYDRSLAGIPGDGAPASAAARSRKLATLAMNRRLAQTATLELATCECCRQSLGTCDLTTEQVWEEELSQLDVGAVLLFGCAQISSPSDTVRLRYPSAALPANPAKRRLHDTTAALGGTPVNMV